MKPDETITGEGCGQMRPLYGDADDINRRANEHEHTVRSQREKDTSMTTMTETRRVKVCAHKEFASEHICGRLSGNHLMQWCPLHPGASTVEIDTPAPQPALDAGEWLVEPLPIHGWRIIDTANKEIVGNIYREEVAARIVDDHAIARTVPGLLAAVHDARASAAAVPKLLEALRSLLDQFYPHRCKCESKDCAKCKALLKGSAVKREVEVLTTVQGKGQG